MPDICVSTAPSRRRFRPLVRPGRSHLGARLSSDSAGGGTASAGHRKPDRLFPPHPLAGAGSLRHPPRQHANCCAPSCRTISWACTRSVTPTISGADSSRKSAPAIVKGDVLELGDRRARMKGFPDRHRSRTAFQAAAQRSASLAARQADDRGPWLAPAHHRGRPARLFQGHPRADGILRAISRSAIRISAGASPICRSRRRAGARFPNTPP